MKSRAIWLSVLGGVAGAVAVALAVTWDGARAVAAEKATAEKAATPAHQVVVCYFHRTVRCPTCKKIGGYVEEAVKKGFAAELKAGTVRMTTVDFQDAKNREYTEAYKITGPTLVLMDVRDGKVKTWKPAPKVWSLVGDEEAFMKYVQGEVRSYLDAEKTAAR